MTDQNHQQWPPLEQRSRLGWAAAFFGTLRHIILSPVATFSQVSAAGEGLVPLLFAWIPAAMVISLYQFLAVLVTIRTIGVSVLSPGLLSELAPTLVDWVLCAAFAIVVLAVCLGWFFPGSAGFKGTLRGVWYVMGTFEVFTSAILLPAFFLLFSLSLVTYFLPGGNAGASWGTGILNVWTWHLPIAFQVVAVGYLVIALREIHRLRTRETVLGVAKGLLAFGLILGALRLFTSTLGVSAKVPGLFVLGGCTLLSWRKIGRSGPVPNSKEVIAQ